MTQFSLGYRIEAKDATQSTIASALSGVTKFAKVASKPITIPLKIGRSGLGLLRDLNLGLRPVLQGFDNILDRGGRLNLVSQSFQSLTGKSAANAEKLARSLVDATSGTVSLLKAQETANRALGSGLNINQLRTAMEFISKKAITTGKDAAHAVDTVITGLSRGTPLFLDDFGILVDGIPGVAREFDRINKSGAFDALGPAAKKAEVIRQAIAEMRQQMGKIGVTGKETAFVFQSIKNSLGDSVDKLFAAIAASKSLQSTMAGARDVIGGITKFIEGGGSIIEALAGKKGGKSGGLLGLLKAGLLDIGEELGRAIAAGLLKVAVRAGDILKGVFDEINPFSGVLDRIESVKDSVQGKVEALQATVDGLFSKLFGGGKSEAATPVRGSGPLLPDKWTDFIGAGASASLSNLPKTIAANAATAVGSRVVAGGAGLYAKVLGKIMADNASTDITNAVAARSSGFFAAAQPAVAPALQRGALAASKFAAKAVVPVITVADFAYTMFKFVKELKGLTDALGDANKAQEDLNYAKDRLEETRRQKALRVGGAGFGMGFGLGGGAMPAGSLTALYTMALGVADTTDKFQKLDEQIDRLIGGGGRGELGGRRFKREKKRFFEDFPPFHDTSTAGPPPIDRSGLRLSEKGFLDRVGKINLLKREIRKIEGQTRRDAGRIAAQRFKELGREGYKLTQDDRDEIRERIFKKLSGERTRKQRERIKQLEDEIDRYFKRIGQEGQAVTQQRTIQPRASQHAQVQPATTQPAQVQSATTQRKEAGFAEDIKNSVGRIEESIGKLVASINGAVTAIAGDERAIASAGGRRT